MVETTLTVRHEAGLHARPLAIFVKTAKAFNAEVQVCNVSNGKGPANGRSPLELLLLAVQQGHDIIITANGPEADKALSALRQLVESNFGEVS